MQEMLRQLRQMGDLQRHLLPRSVPRPNGWNIAVHYAAGSWPGGDYYELLRLSGGRVLLILAYANDHGAASTALVVLLRATLHACPLSSGSERLPFCPFHDPLIQPPHLLLGHLNSVLVDNSLDQQYLTVFCGLLSPAEGLLHYAMAGHPNPLWWRASTRSVERLECPAGLPLGVDHRATYHHKRVEIEPGDVIVCYSDGLILAQNDRDQNSGLDRLEELVRQAAAHGVDEVKSAVLAGLQHVQAGSKHPKDLTLLVLQREL